MRFLDISSWTSERLNSLIESAEILDTTFPDHEIISVGQSPAWIVYALERLRQERGVDPQTKFLSFSGFFLSNTDDRSFTAMKEKYPSKNRLSLYFNYLGEQGIAPEDLIKSKENDGHTPPVFIDFIYDGQGFPSFIHTLQRYVDEKYPAPNKKDIGQACRFVGLRCDRSFSFLSRITIGNPSDASLQTIEIDNIPSINKELNLFLAGSKGSERAEVYSDRLVPAFDISAAGRGKLMDMENEARCNAIKRAIDNTVKRHVSEKERQKHKAQQLAKPSV